MRTIEIQVYKYTELDKESQNRAYIELMLLDLPFYNFEKIKLGELGEFFSDGRVYDKLNVISRNA